MPMDAAFTTFPTLTTERLILRALRPDDAEAMFAIRGDRVTMQYVGSLAHESIDDTREWIDMLLARYEAREGLRWIVTWKGGDDSALGSVSLHHFGPGRTEVGYDLNPAYWGQGIMTEAMRAVLDTVFGVMEMHRAEATIDIANAASKALLLRLGFTYEGNLRERYPGANGFEDEHVFGLLRREWDVAGKET